jgi:hypothetical protein
MKPKRTAKSELDNIATQGQLETNLLFRLTPFITVVGEDAEI